jgi:hypothetical protein
MTEKNGTKGDEGKNLGQILTFYENGKGWWGWDLDHHPPLLFVVFFWLRITRSS